MKSTICTECKHRKLKEVHDPFEGSWHVSECNARGETYTNYLDGSTYTEFPLCSEVNNGKCELFEKGD